MYKASRWILPLLLFVIVMLMAQTPSVAGKWAGLIEIDDGGSTIETSVELVLEQKDGQLSGKIGRTEDVERVEIRNAKIEGDKVTFDASSVEVMASMKFFLTVQGERMKGEMKGDAEGTDIVAKVSFSKVK
jgi:hypothetical protein